MAQIVKLRRSSVSGQKPTNSNLQLGELALNTTDGKVFMAVSGSGGPSVEELILTNTVNTGSINLIGSISASHVSSSFIGDGSELYNIPLSGVTNLVTVSSSLDSRLDVLEAYSSSQQVPTASFSERTLQTDVYCKNVTGVQINKGSVVRVVGNTGDNPLIALADPSSELTSANVLGVTTEDIPNDDWGFVITQGILIGVDTDGMIAGALLFLGINGTFTTTPPTAPNHGVRLGEVLRPQQNNGSILVNIDNGIELNEAHDVTYSGITSGDLLVRNGGVWKNSKSLEGTYNVTGSLVISNNLTVLGSSSFVYVTSSQLAVSASYISVNVFEPAERFGGLKVYDSGSSNATASLLWDSEHNHWIYQNVSGSNYSGGMLLSGPRNTGSLGDEPGLSSGYLPKSVGGDHLDNSIIRESGSAIIIDGGFTATSITGSIDFINLINRPTLVSGSSQIDITGTTNYSTFSSSINTSIINLSSSISSSVNNLSSSIATTDLNQNNRLDEIETSTGSLNTFTSSIDTTIKNKLDSEGVISGSIQIDITNTTGYSTFSSSIATTTNNVETRVGGLETESGSIRSDFNSFTSSYNTGSFTGSFNGNGSGLYNVPASGVTGLQLDRIVNGAASASLQNGILETNTDLIVNGNLTLGGEGIGHLLTIKALLSSSLVPDSNNDHYIGGALKKWKQIYVTTGSIDYIDTINIVNATVSGTFTGSHIGDGAGLYNIPASGVTGLQLDKIINGNASASIDNNGMYVNRDLFVAGTITAEEIHTTYVTSSVLYQSGSTKFGDTSDDTHTFTGSILISGSIVSTDTPLVSGSSQIEITGTTGYSTFSSSIATTTNNVETKVGSLETESGSIRSTFNTFTSSYTTGSFTGSFKGDATDLTNVPFHITGSDIYGNTLDKTFTKLHFDDSTGLNVEETDPGTAFISIGSHFKDIFVSGSPILSATGSDAFEIIPEGGIDITTSITDTNSNGYVKELKISTLNLSSSFNSRIDTVTGSLDSLLSSYNSFTSSTITHLSDLDGFTSSVVLTSQTGSMSVLSASYALTAAFALNANAGSSEGRTSRLDQTSASTTWTFNHNLGEQYPTVTVYDSNDDVVIPSVISADSLNTITITFPSAQSGHAVATVGGGLPYLSGSYDGYVLAGVSNAPTWKGGMVSGSLQVANFGFANTGSNTFLGDQTIEGTLTLHQAQIKQFSISGITVGTYTVTSMATGLHDAAFFDYVVKDGTNMRAGTVTAVWDNYTVKFNEVTTNDIGDTSAVVLSVNLASGNANLRATISSGTWSFKTLVRGI